MVNLRPSTKHKLFDCTLSWFPSGPPQNISSYMTALSHGSPQALHKTYQAIWLHYLMVPLRPSTKQNKLYECTTSWFLSGPPQNISSYMTALSHGSSQPLHKKKQAIWLHYLMAPLRPSTKHIKLYDCTISWFPSGPPQNQLYMATIPWFFSDCL